MKAPILTLACALSLISGSGFCNDVPEFTLTEMDTSIMESFQKGELEGILRIEQGETLPFTLTIEGSVLALKESPAPLLLEALQRVYIKIDKNTFAFSSDKTTWKSFEEYFGGEIGAGFSVSADDDEDCTFGTSGNFYIKMHIK